MMENSFGKTSRLSLKAGAKEGRTFLKDAAFTAPYKIMTPFSKPDGGIQVMPLCASAGIMRGDCQEFSFEVEEGASLEVLSQSFDKIHKMNGGCAKRTITCQVGKNASFCYFPQPVIPFAGSAFDSRLEIHLADDTSRLFLLEIITSGRSAHDECFAYRRFFSLVTICREGSLIYRDNTLYEPSRMDLSVMGFYEGYTHGANLFLSGTDPETDAGHIETIWQILESEPECEGGVTRLCHGDLSVRILGTRAQKLQELAEKIKAAWSMPVTFPAHPCRTPGETADESSNPHPAPDEKTFHTACRISQP